jgi:hypothetical protein
MTKSDFFTPIEPAARTARVLAGREALMLALEQPTVRGGALNTVLFSGSFTKEGVDFDRFVVTLNGADASESDLHRFMRLGARVDSASGRYVNLQMLHDAYDRRLLRIDWTPEQFFFAAFAIVFTLGLTAAAFAPMILFAYK